MGKYTLDGQGPSVNLNDSIQVDFGRLQVNATTPSEVKDRLNEVVGPIDPDDLSKIVKSLADRRKGYSRVNFGIISATSGARCSVEVRFLSVEE